MYETNQNNKISPKHIQVISQISPTIEEITPTQIKDFFYSRFEKDQFLHCLITKQKQSYLVYTEETGSFFIAAISENAKLNKNYGIFFDRNFDKESKLGSLHGAVGKKEFVLYDCGVSPKEVGLFKKVEERELRRYLLKINFLSDKVFRHAKIYLPKTPPNANFFYNKRKDKKDKETYFSDREKIIEIENDFPEYNIWKNKYIYSFSNRVKESSEKNFKVSFEKMPCLECGKINESSYTMDFGYPFSPVEAFAVCLSFLMK